jgi:hypothetical protein
MLCEYTAQARLQAKLCADTPVFRVRRVVRRSSACCPSELASIADGAARPSRPRQGGRADRSRVGREFSHALPGAVSGKPEAELPSALRRDRQAQAAAQGQQADAGAGRCRHPRPHGDCAQGQGPDGRRLRGRRQGPRRNQESALWRQVCYFERVPPGRPTCSSTR